MPRPRHVVVAGGGFAAAELLLALRALAEERVTLELVAPSPRLVFKPAATGHPFGESVVEEYDLRELAHDVGASYRAESVEAVASRASRLRLCSGAVSDYDALVLATGARPVAAIPGATTYRDHRDSEALGRLIGELQNGAVERLVFTAPAGVAWTLPLYELAMLAARAADEAGRSPDVRLVTPEVAPLEVFGPAVGDAIGAVLADLGVTVEPSTRPRRVLRHGLELAEGGVVDADRVVAVPRLVGRPLSGVPASFTGFVPTDEHGRVEGIRNVFAAGDMTSFPIKQGGIATQQADVIAAELAREAGAEVEAVLHPYVLRTRVLGPREPLFLQVELDAAGAPAPEGARSPLSTEAPWWPAAKLFGRHLSPWMASRAVAV